MWISLVRLEGWRTGGDANGSVCLFGSNESLLTLQAVYDYTWVCDMVGICSTDSKNDANPDNTSNRQEGLNAIIRHLTTHSKWYGNLRYRRCLCPLCCHSLLSISCRHADWRSLNVQCSVIYSQQRNQAYKSLHNICASRLRHHVIYSRRIESYIGHDKEVVEICDQAPKVQWVEFLPLSGQVSRRP